MGRGSGTEVLRVRGKAEGGGGTRVEGGEVGGGGDEANWDDAAMEEKFSIVPD